MGYFANYIQNPPGKYLAISAGAIVLIMVFLPELFDSDEDAANKKRRKKKNGETEDSETHI